MVRTQATKRHGALASATILYGSVRALMQNDLKKRLAYSTVSQVSYIVLGASLVGPFAVIGGLVHLVHQGIMKITLFMCAGALANRMGITAIAELDGAGRLMPATMAAFSVGALGMIGSDAGMGVALKAVDSRDARQRGMAALALGDIGRTDAQPALERLLKDKDPAVRLAAATAVLQLR